jgi:hypothetical protein
VSIEVLRAIYRQASGLLNTPTGKALNNFKKLIGVKIRKCRICFLVLEHQDFTTGRKLYKR